MWKVCVATKLFWRTAGKLRPYTSVSCLTDNYLGEKHVHISCEGSASLTFIPSLLFLPRLPEMGGEGVGGGGGRRKPSVDDGCSYRGCTTLSNQSLQDRIRGAWPSYREGRGDKATEFFSPIITMWRQPLSPAECYSRSTLSYI